MKAKETTTCADVEVWLGPLVDGELSDDDQARVEEHLQGCPRCEAERGLLEKTKAALRGEAGRGDAPAALEARVSAALAAERRGGRMRVVAFVAAAVALFVGGLSVGGLFFDDGADRAVRDPLVADSFDRHTLDVPVDIASPDPVRLERYLGTRVKTPLTIPRLDDVGLGLFGARVVNVEHRRAAQLVYHGPAGETLSVTVIPDDDGVIARRLQAERAPRTVKTQGRTTLAVAQKDGALVTAVGDLPAARAHTALDAFVR